MSDHKHIAFKYGTITWTGDGHPSEELIQVFNLMADIAIKRQEIQTKNKNDDYRVRLKMCMTCKHHNCTKADHVCWTCHNKSNYSKLVN